MNGTAVYLRNMEIHEPGQFLFELFLLLGAMHGYYLVLIAGINGRVAANIFLGLLLFAFSLTLTTSFLYQTELIVHVPHFMGIAMPFSFLIGPAFFLYCKYQLKHGYRFTKTEWLHFAPTVVVTLLAMPYYLKAGDEKVAFVGSNIHELPIERAFYLGLQLVQTISYLGLVYQLVQQAKKKDDQWLWVARINKALIGLTAIYVLVVPCYFLLNQYYIELRVIHLGAVSLFIHTIGFLLLRESHFLNQLISQPSLPLSNEQINQIKKKIELQMDQQQPWLKNDFSLKDLSDSIGTNTLYVSNIINQAYGKNFSDFVNHYRINKARQLLAETDLKVFAIALESGFANKNSFNRVFKKHQGMTPSEYKSEMVKS